MSTETSYALGVATGPTLFAFSYYVYAPLLVWCVQKIRKRRAPDPRVSG